MAFLAEDVVDARIRDFDSVLEFDAVVLDLEQVIGEYGKDAWQPIYMGKPNVAEYDSARLVSDISRRRQELLDYVSAGGILICFTPPPISCFVDSGERSYSGTGRNRETTRLLREVSINSIIPVAFATHRATGRTVRWAGNSRYDVLRPLHDVPLQYHAYFAGPTTPAGTDVFTAASSTKPVGVAIEGSANGLVLFLPHLDFESANDEAAVESAFVDLVTTLISSRRASSGSGSPPWLSAMELPEEAIAKRRLAEVDTKLASLNAERGDAARALAAAALPKQLIAASGEALTSAVSAAFLRLGCESVEVGRDGRRDLLISWRGKDAVVEVKGVSGSAAESHAAQLEKWVAEYFVENGVTPKAILVVNAFRDTPPAGRSGPAFPAQMVGYSTQRGHALVTTGQVLSATLLESAGREAFLDALYSTSGVLDWPLHSAVLPDGPLARGSGKKPAPGKRSAPETAQKEPRPDDGAPD